jgi:hypothetical protein
VCRVPITKIEFQSFWPLDIHLVRGQNGQSSGDLRRLLEVTLPDGTTDTYFDYLATHNDVTILFSPLFKKQTETATETRGFGIRVDKKTGNVRISGGAAPTPSPNNFIVEASVTKNAGGVAPETIPIAFIRIHVHQRVERIWFTPPRLTIRAVPGAVITDVGYAFTVRAEFDDGTVGDVTNSDELTYSPPSRMVSMYIRIPASETPGSILPVSVKTSARWQSRTATAEIALLEPWPTENTVPTAELIEGHPRVWDGTLRPESVPNILILGCGFTSSDTAGFEQITNLMVHRLKTDRMLQPFGYLATSMNFWRLMNPAPTAGVSVRCEVAPELIDGQLFALPIPLPAAPPPTINAWRLKHLVYAVGLPVPSDLPLVVDKVTLQPSPTLDAFRQRASEDLNFSALFAKWADTARPVAGQSFDTVKPVLAHAWIALADRTFVDEVDNFPAISIGGPPSAGSAGADKTSNLSFHDLRGYTAEREAFFRRVTAKPKPGMGPIALDGIEPDNALGNLWVTNPDDPDPALRRPFAFDNRPFVAMLSNIPYGRANATIHTRLTLYTSGTSGDVALIQGLPVARVAGRSALTLTLPAPSVMIYDNETEQVLAHELAHTLGLGDEYVEFPAMSPYSEDQLKTYGNLTTPATFLNANDSVRVEDIKWNWHRVRKASVLTGPVVDKGAGLFHTLISLRHGIQFRVGDKIRFRKREPRTVIGRVVTSTVELTVENIPKKNLDDPQDHVNTTVVLKTDPGVDIGGPFGIGSLIYLPVPAPHDIRTAARPYLTLIPPAAERIMVDIGGTMSGKVCDVTTAGDATSPAGNDPAGLVSAVVLPQLVGAYFGGHQYACGVAHPAGMCMMNNSTYTASGNLAGMSSLCPVCRYVLVDQVDPEKHFLNDLDYAKWFPL